MIRSTVNPGLERSLKSRNDIEGRQRNRKAGSYGLNHRFLASPKTKESAFPVVCGVQRLPLPDAEASFGKLVDISHGAGTFHVYPNWRYGNTAQGDFIGMR